MGITAENVAERCHVSRESQDEWAAQSQQRALAARESGHFDREIVGVEIPELHDAGGDVVAAHTVTRDDGPRPGTTVEKLAALKPAFKPDGTVTAGNACPLNDGAAAILVMSEDKADALGLDAAGADHRLLGRRDPPRDHGPRPDPRDPGRARTGRHEHRRHRRRRDERGVRRPGRPVPRRARHRPRQAQHLRRRDRARPPVRDDRRPHHDHPAQQPRRHRRPLRTGVHVRRPAAWARP